MFGGEPGGGSFQHPAHGVKLDHLAAVQLGHLGPAPRRQYQKPVRLQAAEGFPHWGAADVEPDGDLGLAAALAGLVAAVADGAPEPLVHELA